MEKKHIIALPLFCLFLVGCGKHETAGTATGAVIGAAVSGKHSRGTGALIGGLIGNYLGGQVDKNDERQEHKKEVNNLKVQNADLQRQLDKWCENCNRRITIRGAQCCPDCGGHLIQEKFCERCRTTFNPECGYRFCPYCKTSVHLASR
jgi:hypothetical protein